jgi:hypothetical protein
LLIQGCGSISHGFLQAMYKECGVNRKKVS